MTKTERFFRDMYHPERQAAYCRFVLAEELRWREGQLGSSSD